MGKSYEVGELRTFIGNKENECWVAYALDKDTRKVVDLRVGNRTKRMLKPIIDTLLLSDAA